MTPNNKQVKGLTIVYSVRILQSIIFVLHTTHSKVKILGKKGAQVNTVITIEHSS